MDPDVGEYSMDMFRRKRRRMLIVKVAVVVVPILIVARYFAISISTSYSKWEAGLFNPELREKPLPAETRDEIQKLLGAARGKAEASQKAWRAAIEAAAAAKLVERPDLGACPVRVPSPRPDDEFSPNWLNQIRAASFEAAKCNALDHFESRAQDIERDLDREHTARGAARLLEEAKRLEGTRTLWEVTFVIDREVEPQPMLNESYESGVIAGRAYLFDYRSEKVECAALVVGESSESVKFSFRTLSAAPSPAEGLAEFRQALKRDLRISTFREVAERVRFRAGPASETPETPE